MQATPPPTLTPADMADMGFTLTQHNAALGISYWSGHRLSVQISTKEVRIKMLGCGCPLITGPAYPRPKLEMLLAALNMKDA